MGTNANKSININNIHDIISYMLEFILIVCIFFVIKFKIMCRYGIIYVSLYQIRLSMITLSYRVNF